MKLCCRATNETAAQNKPADEIMSPSTAKIHKGNETMPPAREREYISDSAGNGSTSPSADEIDLPNEIVPPSNK